MKDQQKNSGLFCVWYGGVFEWPEVALRRFKQGALQGR
jgi:hypothetical protein